MIDQFAEMYPYDRERMLNKKTEEMEAVERARRESEQMAAQMAALPPPHEITQEQPPQPQAPQEQPQPQPPQPQAPQAPPAQQPPQPQAPPPQEPKQQPKEDTFRPTMMQMLDKDRLKREAVLLQHEQRAFRMRIFRGVLIAIAVGSLVLYFTKRK
jgi:hypothetical protein